MINKMLKYSAFLFCLFFVGFLNAEDGEIEKKIL